MKDYKRLTIRNDDGTWGVNYLELANKVAKWQEQHATQYLSTDLTNILGEKLAELEDKIENGTLVECDVSLLGTQIWTIDKYINGCVDVNIDEQIIIGFVPDAVVVFNITQSFYTEIKNGWWFLTKPEAEAKLKEV